MFSTMRDSGGLSGSAARVFALALRNYEELLITPSPPPSGEQWFASNQKFRVAPLGNRSLGRMEE